MKRIVVRQKFEEWTGPVRGGVFKLKFLWKNQDLKSPPNFHLFPEGWKCAFSSEGWERVGKETLEVCFEAKAEGLIFDVEVREVSGEIIFEDPDQMVILGIEDNPLEALIPLQKFKDFLDGDLSDTKEFFRRKIALAKAMGDEIPQEFFEWGGIN